MVNNIKHWFVDSYSCLVNISLQSKSDENRILTGNNEIGLLVIYFVV